MTYRQLVELLSADDSVSVNFHQMKFTEEDKRKLNMIKKASLKFKWNERRFQEWIDRQDGAEREAKLDDLLKK